VVTGGAGDAPRLTCSNCSVRVPFVFRPRPALTFEESPMSLLNAWFNAFLRSRRAGNLFRRRAMPEAGFGPGSAEAAPFALTTGLVTLAQQEEAELLATLESHADGLSPHEAEERLATLGPNEVDHEKPLPWWRHLWQCYRNPFNLLLTVLAAVSWLTEDIKATVVIGAMVLLSTLIRFVQEGRSNRAAERLKALVGNTARVLRRNPGTEAADVADQYFGAHLHSRRPGARTSLPAAIHRSSRPGQRTGPWRSVHGNRPESCRLPTARCGRRAPARGSAASWCPATSALSRSAARLERPSWMKRIKVDSSTMVPITTVALRSSVSQETTANTVSSRLNGLR